MKSEFFGSVEIIVFHNVLGGINRRWKASIDWRNNINGFDLFAVPEGKGKVEKIFFKIFEFSAVPSRRAELKNYSQRNSFEPFTPRRWGAPFTISVGKRA